MTGREYWLARLRPWRLEGFDRGVLDEAVVELRALDGRRAVLVRPSARGRWRPADLIRFDDGDGDLAEYDEAAPSSRIAITRATAERLLGGET